MKFAKGRLFGRAVGQGKSVSDDSNLVRINQIRQDSFQVTVNVKMKLIFDCIKDKLESIYLTERALAVAVVTLRLPSRLSLHLLRPIRTWAVWLILRLEFVDC